MENEMLISKEFEFEAGHKLVDYAEGRKNTCGNIHGHSYKLIVSIAGVVNEETNMVIDFKEMSNIVKEKVVSKLDHCFINDDLPEIKYSTAENIVRWIWFQIVEDFRKENYRLFEIVLYETRTSSISFRG